MIRSPSITVALLSKSRRFLRQKLVRFTAPDLLIIDNLCLRPLKGEEPVDLYEIIRLRYERGALIITSNRAI